MLSPELPADEAARLASLRALDILDTRPEERFDRITRLAMLACDVPIALVSLVDADRQWFKSRQGLDATETGRDISFCGHAILTDDPLLVEDASADERFADNPLVTGDPRIRFYGGFPLSDGAGHKLGTLCLIDREPRRLTPHQHQLMEELAVMAQTELNSIAREQAILERDAVHRRLEATTEAIDEGLITTDWEGRIVAVNRAIELLFGYNRVELRGRPITTLLPEAWQSQLAAKATLGTGDTSGTTVELPGAHRDGTSFTMQLSTKMTVHGDDRLAITVVRDVTARNEMEESLRHSRQLHESVFAAMHEAVMVLDAEGSVIAANASARELTEVAYAEERSVQNWWIDRIDLGGRSIPFEERPIPRTLATGEPVSGFVMGFPQPSGEVRWLEVDTQPLTRPGEMAPYALVLSMDDITERIEIDRLKSKFVSMVSHELRTPLTAIQGSLRLLNSGALGVFPEQAAQLLTMADTNTERLVRLVNDILDLQRMESDAEELELGECHDEELLDEVVALMTPLANEAGVALSTAPAGLTLVADRDRLFQTLSNLVSNAIKFCRPGGRVSIATVSDGGHIRFAVADDGRGIPSDKLESIFGRFQQVEASDSRAKGGTGLGLAICKQIVERHGGSIWVDSELGLGSEFVFTIPADLALAPYSDAASPVPDSEEAPAS